MNSISTVRTETTSYVIASLHDARYAFETTSVYEIFSLPELQPVAEAPPYIAGVLNLRGRVIPVMDLSMRLFRRPHTPRLSDSVLVLGRGDVVVGVIMTGVTDVVSISAGRIDPAPSYGTSQEETGHPGTFVRGLARMGESVISVIDVERLIGLMEEVGPSDPREFPLPGSPLVDAVSYNDKPVLRERARSLARAAEDIDDEARLSVAIFLLGGEYYGVTLDVVREFAGIREVTAVPCCSEHIVGQMNLRGEILTLVDIRNVLGLPIPSTPRPGFVIVLRMENLLAGVVADAVLDVVHLKADEILPVQERGEYTGGSYVTGVTGVGERAAGILDFKAIFNGGQLEVNAEQGSL